MLVIVDGQSNNGYMNDGVIPAWPPMGPFVGYASDPNTYIWNDLTREWEQMVPGNNTGNANNPRAWGPEVGFEEAYRAGGHTDNLAFIKVFHGETGIAQDPSHLDWSPLSHGEMFDQNTDVITRAMAQFGGVEGWKPVVLFSGMETDATDHGKALAAHDNLVTLVNAMEARWDASEVVVARIGDSASLPFSLDVRQAQWLVDQERTDVSSFKTIGMGRLADGVHLDAGGYLQAGHGFFDALSL